MGFRLTAWGEGRAGAQLETWTAADLQAPGLSAQHPACGASGSALGVGGALGMRADPGSCDLLLDLYYP